MRVAIVGSIASTILGFRRVLIESLVERGDVVYAFASDYDEKSRAGVLALGASPIDYRLSRRASTPLMDVCNTFALACKLRALQLDLVFSYFSKPVVFATFAAALAGVERKIGMIEGLGQVFAVARQRCGLRKRLLRWCQILLFRQSFKLLSCIVFLNPDDKKCLVDTHMIKVRRWEILGGIGLKLDEYRYSLAPVSPVSFVFVGRLLVEKGVNEFIAAARAVKDQHPETRFVVLGSWDDSNMSSRQRLNFREAVDTGVIDYPGHVDNVAERIANCSVFVLPSYYREGVPRSTQEAMAVGRPVITIDLPGCRETVVEGVNGFLVPPWDVERLCEKMIYFIDEPGRVNVMGAASRELAVKNFDGLVVNKRLLRIIDGESS